MFDFARPPHDFYPLLHWDWESFARAAPEAREQTLGATAQAGFSGVVLHVPLNGSTAAPGVQALGEACAGIGLKLWLHLNTAAVDAEHTAQHLVAHTEEVAREDALHWEPPVEAGEQVVCAVAAPLDAATGKLDFERAVDFTAALQSDTPTLPGLPGTRARIFVFSIAVGDGLDWMSDGAAQELVQRLEPLLPAPITARHGVAGFFIEAGDTVDGASGRLRLPWSPLLPDAFSGMHRDYLIRSLPSLLADTGPGATQVRQHFWTMIAALSERNFRQPIDHWAASRNLEVRHCLTPSFDSPRLQELIQQGDSAQLARTGHRVAITDVPEDTLSLRVATSVAALKGSPGPTVEIGRSFGWEATLADKVAHFHRLLHHGAHGVSISSPPAGDAAAPGELLQPYWSQWRAAADYMARAAAAMAQGKAGARVGVLLPTRSEWAHHHPRGHRYTRWVSEDLSLITALLDDLHYDFLYLREPDLCEAGVAGRLIVGVTGQPIDMLVIPSITTLSRPAWEKIEEFVEAGGKVACFGLLPRWSEQGRDEEFQARIDKSTMVHIDELYEAYATMESGGELPATIGYPVYREHRSGGRMCAYQPRLNTDTDDARLRVRQILRESLAPDFETQSPAILYTRRALEGGDLFFILNADTLSQHINAHLRGCAGATPHEFDAWAGAAHPLPVWTPYTEEEGGGAGLELDLAPGEGRLIWLQHPSTETNRTCIEHATFLVEEFNEGIARGYSKESGQPRLAIREQGKLRWYSGEIVTVPPYLLLDDEWSAVCPEHPEIEPLLLGSGSWYEQGLPDFSGLVEYSQRVVIPETWHNCRVFLELSRLRDVAEVVVNGITCGVRVNAPYSFEITPAITASAVAEIKIGIWNTAQAAQGAVTGMLEPAGLLGPARLVAYPIVEVVAGPTA